MFIRQATRTAITRVPALTQPRIALATRAYADLGSPHSGPAGAPPPRHPADAPRDAPPGIPRPPPQKSEGSGTMLMVGGGVALAGVMYYAFFTDKSSVKGKAKELEGRAKELEGRAKGKAHEVTGEIKRGYEETVGEVKRAVK